MKKLLKKIKKVLGIKCPPPKNPKVEPYDEIATGNRVHITRKPGEAHDDLA